MTHHCEEADRNCCLLCIAQENAPKRQRVFGAALVRGRPFYGFHAADAVFVKVMLLSPRDVTKAAGLLQAGGILGRRFQPYESHLPYLLQFKVRRAAS